MGQPRIDETQADPSLDQWRALYEAVSRGAPGHAEHAWRYAGLDIWPIVKAQLLMRASNVLLGGRDMRINRGRDDDDLRRGAGERYDDCAEGPGSLAFDDLPALPWTRASDVLCLGYATNHKAVGDRYVQLCADPIRLALSRAGVSSVGLIAGFNADDAAIRNSALADTLGVDDAFAAVRRFETQAPGVAWGRLPEFEPWWRSVGAIVGSTPITTLAVIERTIKQTYLTAVWLRREFERLTPRAVLVSAYYGLIGHGGSWACRQLGLPIADIQHGVAGSAHHAYDWPNTPSGGFSTLPTAFLTWSQREVEDYDRAPGPWRPVALPVGNVWRLLDAVTDGPPSADGGLMGPPMHRDLRAEIERQRGELKRLVGERGEGGVRVLLALHPDERIDWFPELRASAPSDWRFMVRLHPGDLRNPEILHRFLDLRDERTFVEPPSLSLLNVVLGCSDVVLTKMSSVMFDALAYGVPSVGYSEATRIVFGAPERSLIATAPRIPHALIAAIRRRVSPYAARLIAPEPESDLATLGSAVLAALDRSVVSRAERVPSGATESETVTVREGSA